MIVREIGIILVFAGLLGIIIRLLKQPTILAYVLAGVIVGPLALGLISHTEVITELSELAAVIMLFVIGIEMDLSRLKKVGLVAIAGGAIQVGLMFMIGFGVSKVFNLNNTEASYMGFVIAFSSTMLAVKVLGEKYDLSTLYGRISMGILIMQDILAIFALSVLGSSNEKGLSIEYVLNTSTLAAGLILIIIFIGGKFIIPKLFQFAARDREMLFIVTMSSLFIIGFYAESQKLSMGIGSFLAGLAIAKVSYRYEIIGDLKALKSFFLILFFAGLGLQLVPSKVEDGVSKVSMITGFGEFFSSTSHYFGLIAAFLVLALVIKPMLTTLIVRIFGYEKSTAINVGLSIGQLSEFGLVLVAQGVKSGQLNAEIMAPMIIATVVSMIVSSYIMNANNFFVRILGKKISWMEKVKFFKTNFNLPEEELEEEFEIVIVGLNRLGFVIQKALQQHGFKYIVVDSNPDIIEYLNTKNIPCIFGDVNNHDVLEQLQLKNVTTVFSTVPDLRDNELLIRHIAKTNPSVNFVGITDSRNLAKDLYEIGAHYVLVTYVMAAAQFINKGAASNNTGIDLRTIIRDSETTRRKGQEHREVLFKEEDYVLEGDKDTEQN